MITVKVKESNSIIIKVDASNKVLVRVKELQPIKIEAFDYPPAIDLLTERVVDAEQSASEALSAVNNKVDKVTGKGLSTNDLTNELKTAYDGAATHAGSSHAPADAQKNVQPDWNQANNAADDFIKNKPATDDTYFIRLGTSAASIKSKLDQFSNKIGAVKFEPGEYIIDQDIFIYNSRGLNIDFNGAVFKSTNANGNVISISTASSTTDKYFRMIGASADWFLADMPKGQFYIPIVSPLHWVNLVAGDMIIIGDSRAVNGVSNSMGLVLIFNRLEQVEGVWRIYFDYQSRGDLQCKTNLKYVSSFGGGNYVCHVPLKGEALVNNGVFNNVKLQLVGYNSAFANNITVKQNVFPFASNDQVGSGLEISYCKDIIVDNLVAHGFNQTGYGYGFTSLAWDKVIISNFIGYNCKHCFTSSTTYYHFSNVVKITNALFAATLDQVNNPTSNGSPLDQHAGIWEMDVDGIRVENCAIGAHCQAVNVSIKNAEFYDCSIPFTLDIGEIIGMEKERIYLDNIKIIRPKIAILSVNNNVRVNEIIVKGMYVDFSGIPQTENLLGFYTAGPTSFCRTLIIRDSDFIGRKHSSSGDLREDFISISNDYTSVGFENIDVINSRIKNWRYILRSALPLMEKVNFDNCDIDGFIGLISTGNLTSAGYEGYKNVSFKSNRISNGNTLIDLAYSKFLAKRIEFIDNRFKFIAQGIINSSNNKFDSIIFKDNKVTNSFYLSGRVFVFGSVELTYLLEENNTYFKQSQALIDAMIAAYSGTGYEAATTPKYTCAGMYISQYNSAITEVDVVDNKYYTDGFNEGYLRLVGGKGKVSGNKFFVKLIQTRLCEFNGRNTDFYNNIIVLSDCLANTEIIRSLTAGATIKAIGNTIVNNSASGTAKLLNISGINYYEAGNNKFKVNLADSIVGSTLLTP